MVRRPAGRRPDPAQVPVRRGTRNGSPMGPNGMAPRRRLEGCRSRPSDRPAKWRIGEPDLVLKTTPFDLPTEGDIPYKYVILPHVFEQDTWVRGVQILPDVPRASIMPISPTGRSAKFKESNFVTGVRARRRADDGRRRRRLPDPEGEHARHADPLRADRQGGESAPSQRRPEVRRGKVDKGFRHMLFVDTPVHDPAGARPTL